MTGSARLRSSERESRERKRKSDRESKERERERGRERERESEREGGATSCLRLPEPNVAQVCQNLGLSIQRLAWKAECVVFSLGGSMYGGSGLELGG